ncbi:MAG TPA: hypothetical protein VIM51_12215 [Desulfosporosinus sp.]
MGRFQPIRERLSDEEQAIVDYINLTLTVRQMTKTHLASAMGENVLRIYNCLSKRTHLQEDLKIQIFKTLGIRNTEVQNVIDGMTRTGAEG